MSKTKILLAEDDEMLISLLSFRLKKEGYELITVKDGREAKEKIQSEQPDLIVSDIMMPFVSGLEIIGFVKNELNQKTPVIILSTAGQEKTVLEAFNLGADDFISKPFSPNELVIRIRKMTANS